MDISPTYMYNRMCRNWALTIGSGFSIGAGGFHPLPWEPRKKYAVGNSVKGEGAPTKSFDKIHTFSELL